MKRVFRRIALIALVVALVLALGSCLYDLRGRTHLLLKVTDGERALTVTEYDVTSLVIEVVDSEGGTVDTVTWLPEQGTQNYLIPLPGGGEYTVNVTHVGELDGAAYEATESSLFTVRAMGVTVVTIIPGMIGVVDVEGDDGGGTCPECEMLVGTWMGLVPNFMGTAAETLWVELAYNADGTCHNLFYESETGPLITEPGFRGNYTCADAVLTGEWNEQLNGGIWEPMDAPIEWAFDLTGISDPWELDVDLDMDGVIDATWTLHKQP